MAVEHNKMLCHLNSTHRAQFLCPCSTPPIPFCVPCLVQHYASAQDKPQHPKLVDSSSPIELDRDQRFEALQRQVDNLQECLILSLDSSADRREIIRFTSDTPLVLLYLGLRKHGVSLGHIRLFNEKLKEEMGREDIGRFVTPFCRNFLECLQERASEKTKTDSQKILNDLIDRGMGRRQLEDWKSLFHVLSREQMLPFDLASLAVYSDIRPPTALAEVRSDHLRQFDCVNDAWGAKVTLSGVTPIKTNSYSAITFLTNGNLFACGANNPYITDTYQINPQTGLVVRLRDMLSPNSLSGVLRYFNWVYSFGGYTGANLQRAEKYSLVNDTWTQLPNMQTARRCFIPCLHKHLIYICGGGSDTYLSEVFDPVTELYTPLTFTLPETNHTRAVVIGDEITVICPKSIVKVDLNSRTLTRTQTHVEYRAFGAIVPVVLGSQIWYNVWENSQVLRIHVDTGALERSHPYPG